MESILSGKMPSEWEDSLNKLEAQVANSDQWPKDASEAKRFDGEISDLVTDLPAWADANYLPRLNLVRWASLVFNHLNDSQNPDALLNDLAMAEEMRSLADTRPNGEASDLDQKLREKAKKVEEQQVDKAIEWVEQHLKKDANTQQDSTEAGPDIAGIYEFLGRHENNLAQNDQKRTKIAPLRKELEGELYRTVEEQQAQAKRKYQEWALKEIKAFEEKLRNVIRGAGKVSEKAKKDGWLSLSRWVEGARAFMESNFRDEHYKAIQNAMISHLLPIDLALLELPVLKLYHQAFEIGWKTLDERDEQTVVAKKSALTVKKPLWTVLED